MHPQGIPLCRNVNLLPWCFANGKAAMDADGGNCSLLAWLRCCAHVSNETQGVFFSTKFIVAPKVIVWTVSSPTRPCPISKKVVCANRYACVAFAHTTFFRCKSFKAEITIVLEVIDDIEKKCQLPTYKNKGSTRECDCFRVM